MSIKRRVQQAVQAYPQIELRGHTKSRMEGESYMSAFQDACDGLINQVAQERDRCARQSKFITKISEETRKSLSIIMGSAWMLEVHGNNLDATQRRNHHNMIHETALVLTQKLDAYQHWQDDYEEPLKPISVDLEALWRSLISSKKISISSPIIRLKVSGFIQRFAVLDPDKIKLILDNLLDNALKFSAAGSPVDCRICWGKNDVELEIKDFGIGIPVDEQEFIFAPFYRASNARAVTGFGLGLAKVQKAIRQHNGSVAVNSIVNQGTVMKVTFPISQAASSEAAMKY